MSLQYDHTGPQGFLRPEIVLLKSEITGQLRLHVQVGDTCGSWNIHLKPCDEE